MSRKNKNGKRRNYTPKTYGRDFLTPTPIERAIQEVNKPASPQAVAVSDRIACDDKCSYEYKRMPAAWLETDFSYQRKIDSARVERIVNSFDPRLANEVKVSFRDGKFYVFDGAHTLSALKRIHGEDSFMVDCKVYYGLSYEDEAYLFALQSGESNAALFSAMKAYFEAGNSALVLYNGETSSSSGYSSNYARVTSCTITVTYIDAVVWYCDGGTWKRCTVWYRSGGAWKQVTPYYNSGGNWVRV